MTTIISFNLCRLEVIQDKALGKYSYIDLFDLINIPNGSGLFINLFI